MNEFYSLAANFEIIRFWGSFPNATLVKARKNDAPGENLGFLRKETTLGEKLKKTVIRSAMKLPGFLQTLNRENRRVLVENSLNMKLYEQMTKFDSFNVIVGKERFFDNHVYWILVGEKLSLLIETVELMKAFCDFLRVC